MASEFLPSDSATCVFIRDDNEGIPADNGFIFAMDCIGDVKGKSCEGCIGDVKGRVPAVNGGISRVDCIGEVNGMLSAVTIRSVLGFLGFLEVTEVYRDPEDPSSTSALAC